MLSVEGEEQTPGDNVLKQREEKPKKVKDFLKMVKDKKIKNMKEQDVKIKSIPKNLSKTDECEGKKLNIEIERASNDFKQFIRNHEKIKQHYIKYNRFFLNYITKNIVKIEKGKRYELMKIDSSSLNNIEKDVRDNLVKYYTECQRLFNESFALLVDGVQRSGNTKIINTPVEIPNNQDENKGNETQNKGNKTQNKVIKPKIRVIKPKIRVIKPKIRVIKPKI